jgi:hypothetical protein
MNFFQKLYQGVLLLRQMRNKKNETIYTQGKFPGFLHGLYSGSIDGIDVSWKGKYFEKDALGINIFNEKGQETKAYPFKVYQSKGIYNKNLETLKIDYNLKENSFFVRLILDELVEVHQEKYLGKVFLRILPGRPFFLGYFHLQKAVRN